MTTSQKIRKAKELVLDEQDGSNYLQRVCTVRELREALTHTRKSDVKEIIQDAITIKQHNNKRSVTNVSL